MYKKIINVDNMLKSNLGYKKCLRFELYYHNEYILMKII
jgi:hypothetical protein